MNLLKFIPTSTLAKKLVSEARKTIGTDFERAQTEFFSEQNENIIWTLQHRFLGSNIQFHQKLWPKMAIFDDFEGTQNGLLGWFFYRNGSEFEGDRK